MEFEKRIADLKKIVEEALHIYCWAMGEIDHIMDEEIKGLTAEIKATTDKLEALDA
jgi:hypothetical protein